MNKSFLDKEPYLQQLFLKLEESFAKNETQNIKLLEPKEKGFLIKIGGLYGYLPFSKMPWHYKDYSYWSSVAAHLTGLILKGEVLRLNRESFSILASTSGKITFDLATLKRDKTYQGVVLKRVKYGFFIDLGISFSWQKGSILGLMHQSNCPIDSASWAEGEVVDCKIYDLESDHKIALIHPSVKKQLPKLSNDELSALVGTYQKAKVIIKKNGERRVEIGGKYLGILPIQKNFYPGKKKQMAQLIRQLMPNDEILCEVVKANLRKKILLVKYLVEL